MKDQSKTKQALIQELASLRQRISELEQSESDRKNVMEALRESEEKYRVIFNNEIYAILIFDLDTFKLLDVNDAFTQMYGYTREELLSGMTIHNITAEHEASDSATEKARNEGTIFIPLRYHKKKDGTIFPVEIVGGPYEWEGKQVMFALFRDITERKQAADALLESEERFHKLASAGWEGLVFHKDGILIDGNKQFLTMFGYSSEEIIGKSVLNFLAPESIDLAVQKLKQYSLGGESYFEAKGLRKDKTIFSLELMGRPIRYKDIDVRVLAIRDITERKRAEEALRESEEHYRRLAEDMPALICTFLPDSTLTYVNSAYCELFQKRSDELIGQKFLYFLQDEADREAVRRQYMSLTPENSIKTYEHDVIIADGTNQHHWHRWTDRAFFKDNGEIDHFQSIGQDITGRKQVEEELRTSHTQLRALATRLQQIREESMIIIAREIHDELGGGLTGLKMDLSWLLGKMSDADPGEERVALMDKIHTSNELIDQMIHVVRRISTDLRPSVLDDLGLIAALEWQAQEFTRRTEIPCEFVTSLDYVNLEDETATGVFRIFKEALTNVRRHSRATKVAIVLRESERSLFGDETLVLEIRDNGRGITEEEMLNPESFGLLGMKERVMTFGGNLSIRGEPGGGTTLVLKIPRKQGENRHDRSNHR